MQNETNEECRKSKNKLAEWKKVLLALAVFAGVLAIIYLGIVFLRSFGHGSDIDKVIARPGYSKPIFPMECEQVLQDTSLNPRYKYPQTDSEPTKNKSKISKSASIRYQPPEFKEYGNIWLWDNGETRMYDSNILKHPACVDFLLQRMTATYKKLILVIYDKQLKSEVLVIRNYNK